MCYGKAREVPAAEYPELTDVSKGLETSGCCAEKGAWGWESVAVGRQAGSCFSGLREKGCWLGPEGSSRDVKKFQAIHRRLSALSSFR